MRGQDTPQAIAIDGADIATDNGGVGIGTHTKSFDMLLLTWRWHAAIALLALGVFLLHFPGQATYDTLAQAYDGATRVYTSNQPPAMSWLLSVLSLPGLLALQIAMYALAVSRLLTLSRCSMQAQYFLALALFLLPVPLIYVGIVWKDVLFAHAALLALLLLPRAALEKSVTPLVISAVVLALAAAVRQQAVIIAVVSALFLLFAGGWRDLKSGARWVATLLWIAIFCLCSTGIKFIVQSSGDTSQSVAYEGPIGSLAKFDLGGILSHVPTLEFPTIESGVNEVPAEYRPDRERLRKMFRHYSPARVDYMNESDPGNKMWIPTHAWLEDWRLNVLHYPRPYIEHRLDAMSYILGWHGPEQCLPYHVGILSEPENMVATLGVTPGLSRRAQLLGDIGDASLFLFRPWIYICLSVVTLAYLFVRGDSEHGVVIVLQLCGLLYVASYFFIGLACDFRYTYFTTLVALFGVAYVFGLKFRIR